MIVQNKLNGTVEASDKLGVDISWNLVGDVIPLIHQEILKIFKEG